jgi:uncharacterized cupin superfamily protein
MTDVKLALRGLRGESFADVARRIGNFAGYPVASDATDAEVLDLLTDAVSELVAAGSFTVIAPVRVATTANITLSGAQTIDGVAVVAGNRVLVKDQSSAAQNGIYVAAAGAWSRATDFNETSEVVNGAYVTATAGSTQAASAWVMTSADPITVGTTAQTWTLFRDFSQMVTLAGTQTLSNKSISGELSIFTGGDRIGITDDSTALGSIGALLHIVNEGSQTGTLRASSYWTGTTALPYQNNDTTLFETFNEIQSNSENYSWSVSAANAYNDIPTGVTDLGQRIGVLGWAVSARVPGTYEHIGTLEFQMGVRGRAGFQGTGSTGTVNNAIGVRGEIYNDSSGATVVNGIGVEALSSAVAGPVQNAYAVRALASGGTVTNWSFHGDAGVFFNEDKALFGSKFTEFDSAISARGVGSTIEFGFPGPNNGASSLGSTRTSGRPFLAFSCENETGDTFTTRGDVGHVIFDNLDGGVTFSRAATATAADQALTDDLYWDLNGRFQFARTPIFPAFAPASAGATGQTGQFAWDSSYLYICIGTNTWKRVAIATW